jgi:pyruvate dehydrogenase E2 component (dihydrolipoamide acetyltransferase)
VAELLRMPEVATGTTEAVLASWSIAENASFTTKDVIATIETAKAVVDIEAETDGVLLRLLVAPGAEVEAGAPIALVAGPAEDVADVESVLRDLGFAPAFPADPVALDVPEAATTPEPTPLRAGVPAPEPQPAGGRERVFASPLARRRAREAGLSVEQITGTGPHGRIVRRDVELAVSTSATSSTASAARRNDGETTAVAAWTDVPHSRLRRLIAARLTESKQMAPHFYLRGTVQVDRLLALRQELNEDGAQARISVNDLVIKAVARAHALVPALNVIWTPDAIRSFSTVDVSVAVATDNGLVTPVLRSVQDMSVSAVARGVQDFVDRAKTGRLRQHELEGGSVSVTNLGMFGTEEFAAIINPPQASILAVGAARQEPVVVDGGVRPATCMRVTLSVDHRAVDGVAAAEWMRVLVSFLEHPARILA